MTDFNHGDAYRLRALGVSADSDELRVITGEELLRACLNALIVVQRERDEALAAATRWRRLFWLCTAALVAAVTRKWLW